MEATLEKELEEMRARHGLRPLTGDEEGLGIDDQPPGVYGFTYSPAEENFPLFPKRLLRTYEAHKHPDGSTYLLGFLTPGDHEKMKIGRERLTIHLFAEPEGEADRLTVVPMSRVLGHRPYSQREGKGLEMEVGPFSS